MAASWLRTLSLKNIIVELEKGLDLLQSSAQDLPQRHKSIRVVFDYSWQLLSQEEQAVMKRLAVFQSGFSLAAAQEIAGASLLILANLIDKSFLSTTNERYRRHPLVIQYIQEKLQQNLEEKSIVEDKHSRYFLHFIRQLYPKLRGL